MDLNKISVGKNPPYEINVVIEITGGSSGGSPVKYEFDKEVLSLVNEAYVLAKTFLANHKEILNKIVDDLLEKEILIGNEIVNYLKDHDESDDCNECDV